MEIKKSSIPNFCTEIILLNENAKCLVDYKYHLKIYRSFLELRATSDALEEKIYYYKYKIYDRNDNVLIDPTVLFKDLYEKQNTIEDINSIIENISSEIKRIYGKVSIEPVSKSNIFNVEFANDLNVFRNTDLNINFNTNISTGDDAGIKSEVGLYIGFTSRKVGGKLYTDLKNNKYVLIAKRAEVY